MEIWQSEVQEPQQKYNRLQNGRDCRTFSNFDTEILPSEKNAACH